VPEHSSCWDASWVKMLSNEYNLGAFSNRFIDCSDVTSAVVEDIAVVVLLTDAGEDSRRRTCFFFMSIVRQESGHRRRFTVRKTRRTYWGRLNDFTDELCKSLSSVFLNQHRALKGNYLDDVKTVEQSRRNIFITFCGDWLLLADLDLMVNNSVKGRKKTSYENLLVPNGQNRQKKQSEGIRRSKCSAICQKYTPTDCFFAHWIAIGCYCTIMQYI